MTAQGASTEVTKGFAGARNGNTVIRYDLAAQRVREDSRCKNRTVRAEAQ